MQIGNVTQPSAGNVAASPNKELTGEAFLSLLIAQLRAQNPLEPISPTEFVTQLVQFNTLEQIIGIRRAVEANPGGPDATPDTAWTPQS